LARWGNHFSQLFNVHGADDVRQRVIHTGKPLVPESSAFDVGMAIEKLKRYKTSGIDQILAELIKQGAEQFALRSINLFILFGLRRIVPEWWKGSIIVPIYKKGDTSSCSKYRGITFCPLRTKMFPTSCRQG
jgi:hypothetical protein